MIVQNLGLSAIKSGNFVTEHNFVKNKVPQNRRPLFTLNSKIGYLQFKVSVSRDWIGPCIIVLMDKP